MGKGRRLGAASKVKLALAAIKWVKTSIELAAESEVRPTLIAKWKRQLLDSAPTLFEDGRSSKAKVDDTKELPLFEQIGKLPMELAWLEKS